MTNLGDSTPASGDATQVRVELLSSGVDADVRAPSPADAVDGVMPATVVAPRTASAMAAVLQWADNRDLSAVMRGSGTKLGWGRPCGRVDVVVSTEALNRVIAHRAGDLTATVEAGAAIADVNRALMAHGQWLPLDSSFGDAATIGGLLATNDAGPLRHRFGTPRDQIIGIEVATTDGRLSKAGGQVVKNVAGYDLSKLMSGSFGELAAIVSATFKLQPVAPSSAVVRAMGLDAARTAAVVMRVSESQIEPVCFEVHAALDAASSAVACVLAFANVPAVVASQADAAAALMASLGTSPEIDRGDTALGAETQTQVSGGPGAIVRASWLPARIGDVLALLATLAPDGPIEFVGRAGVGAGFVRIAGDVPRQAAAIEQLRASQLLGNVVIVRAEAGLKSRVDVWGPQPTRTLQQAIKRTLDPGATLGAHRGPF